MSFAEKLERYLNAAGEEELERFLGGGFSFETDAAGYTCAVRRSRDLALGEEVETEFLLFDKNGGKKKLTEGLLVILRRQAGAERSRTRLHEVRRPTRTEVYYAQAASRGGRLIGEQGGSDYLKHDVMIGTPEKEWIPLAEFDFAKHPLFMLGLYGGEYQIGVRDKA